MSSTSSSRVPPLAAPRDALDKLMQLGRSGGYEADLAEMAVREKAGHAEFRRILAANRVTHLDRYIDDAARAPATSVPRR